MKPNLVKQRLQAGELVLGTMVQELMTPSLFRIAQLAGAEFVFLDLEHTAWSLETLRSVIAGGLGTDLDSIVRVPDAEYHLVTRVLDAGANGVMIPSCEGEEEARALVRWAKYPPAGVRGFGLPRYELEREGVGATFATVNEQQLVIVQIETAGVLEEVELIAAVDGVDVLWIGHFDLSAALGIPGDFDSPVFRHAVDRVVAAAQAEGKTLGVMAGTVADARRWIELGFRCVAYSIDAWLYEEALRAGLDQLRSG
jgi:2-keto-3-deoxy-L-rhamnonate aldolase RhmA